MNSDPLSESIPLIGKGNAAPISRSAANTQRWALFFTAPGFGPAGGDVGDVQALAEVPSRVAALVPDTVDLDIAGLVLIPVGPGPDRDLALEQRTGLGG